MPLPNTQLYLEPYFSYMNVLLTRFIIILFHSSLSFTSAKVPSPRGAHTACVDDTLLWVFGGYGGLGYGRKDFNDLFTLDLEDWAWHRVAAKGKVRRCKIVTPPPCVIHTH